MDNDLASPLVMTLARLIWWLRYHSIHGYAKRKISRLGTDAGIEAWVLFFTLVSLVAFVAVPSSGTLCWIFVAIGIYRLYEIAINVLHATIFYGVIDRKKIAGYRRIVILHFANLAEIIFWFGYFYRRIGGQFEPLEALSTISVLSYSFSTATGVGSPPITASSDISVGLSVIESAFGLFMIVAVIAKFISVLTTDPDNNSA